MGHITRARELLAKEKESMNRLVEIDRCLRVLSDEFCRVARIQDAEVTVRFFEAKDELHRILAGMAGEENKNV